MAKASPAPRQSTGPGGASKGWRKTAHDALIPNWAIIIVVLVAGGLLGLAFPNRKLPWATGVIQSGVGWSYTLAWSLSFWPQVILNYRRKNVSGLSFDFLALNLLGWVSYSAFNVALYYVFTCPDQTASSNGLAAAARGLVGDATVFLGAGPRAADFLQVGEADTCRYAVDFNDVVFALHALALTAVTVVQCVLYQKGKDQRVHIAWVIGICFVTKLVLVYAAAIAGQWRVGDTLQPWLQWVYWLYFLSFIKMGVTLVKYIPQAVLNARLQSTRGWSILNILLDFLGGVLSLGQQLLTCYYTGNWAPILANPVKLGLAIITIIMDVVFMTQHYVLYPDSAVRRICPKALRRVGAVLRALASAPEQLPFEVAEDALLSLGEHGVDVTVPKIIQYYADHPEQLPVSALDSLLGAYWCAGGAAGMARSGGRGKSGGGAGVREPLLPTFYGEAASTVLLQNYRDGTEERLPQGLEGLETLFSYSSSDSSILEVEVILAGPRDLGAGGPAAGSAAVDGASAEDALARA